MNKKILFLILLAVLFLPLISYAVNAPDEMAEGVKDLVVTIGASIVVIGWVVAGILYLTAGGAPEKTGTAKKAMIAAVIGTVLVVVATLGYDAIKGLLDPIIGGGAGGAGGAGG